MSKIIKGINAIFQILMKPYLLNLVINEESNWKKYVHKKYGLTKGLPLVDITELFPNFNETVKPYSYLDGATLPIDIALLKALSRKYNVKNYFEIGTWRGESVSNVAEIVPNCTSLNLSDIELFELGCNEQYVKMHRFFSQNIPNIEHIMGDSQTFDFSNYHKKIDLVFVDGDHHYESVQKDTITALNLIKDERGIIVWHDYAIEPETVRWSVLAGILDAIPLEKRKNLYHVSNSLCAVYIDEKFSTTNLIINSKPNHWFEINIKAIHKSDVL